MFTRIEKVTTLLSPIQAAPIVLQNRVIVGTKSDLPAPDAGVIDTVANTQYLVTAGVSVDTDRISLADNVSFTGLNSDISSLTYIGTGDMFTGVGTNNRLERITINSPTAGSKTINYDGLGVGILQFIDMTFGSVDTLGVLKDVRGSQVNNVAFGSVAANGFLFTGSHSVFLVFGVIGGISAGTLFDLGTATFDTLSITDSFPDIAAGATMLSGAPDSANINANGFGTVINTNNKGLGTDLSGITNNDVRWQFTNNSGIPDSRPDGWISMPTLTTTVIDNAGEPKLLAGTWNITSPNRVSQFVATTAGRLTYKGVKGATLQVDISTTMKMASGSNKEVRVLLFKDGVVVANAFNLSTVGSATSGSASVIAQIDFVTDTFIEVFISNEEDQVNIDVSKADLRIN